MEQKWNHTLQERKKEQLKVDTSIRHIQTEKNTLDKLPCMALSVSYHRQTYFVKISKILTFL